MLNELLTKILDKVYVSYLGVMLVLSAIFTVLEFAFIGYMDDEKILLLFTFNIIVLIIIVAIKQFLNNKVNHESK